MVPLRQTQLSSGSGIFLLVSSMPWASPILHAVGRLMVVSGKKWQVSFHRSQIMFVSLKWFLCSHHSFILDSDWREGYSWMNQAPQITVSVAEFRFLSHTCLINSKNSTKILKKKKEILYLGYHIIFVSYLSPY